MVTKIDLGCGKSKKPGFIGFDQFLFEGVDVVTDLTLFPWGFMEKDCSCGVDTGWTEQVNDIFGNPVAGAFNVKSDSVQEAHASHFVEHLDRFQRVAFWNELYRVLEPGGKATIIVPHWSSSRAYGDPTHQWPPMSEFCWFYLNKKWRDSNTPHLSEMFKCDFDSTWGYSLDPTLTNRNEVYQQFASRHFKDCVMDMSCTLVKLV